MALPILTISTDLPKYINGAEIFVTASMTQWYPGAKVKLVIWDEATTKPIIEKDFVKPKTGDTVKWEVTYDLIKPYRPGNFYAQIEFGHLEASAEFIYT